MAVKKSHAKKGGGKLLLLSILVIIVVFLTVCVVLFWVPIVTYWEPCAPQRSFKLEDLLIDQSIIPTVWGDVWGPDTESYDGSCNSTYTSIGFGVAERELPLQVTHEIDRSGKITWARLSFENSQMFSLYPEQPTEWTYESTVADQSYFGCANERGTTQLSMCQWVGRYDEITAILWVRMTPNEVNMEDIERMVKAIDARMALHLGK